MYGLLERHACFALMVERRDGPAYIYRLREGNKYRSGADEIGVVELHALCRWVNGVDQMFGLSQPKLAN